MGSSRGPIRCVWGASSLRRKKIFVNVGGRATELDLPGVKYFTNSSIMEVDFVPKHLIVVGGSYIGLEFGQMYRRFGSEVTIVDRGTHLTQMEDDDTSLAVKEILGSGGSEHSA